MDIAWFKVLTPYLNRNWQFLLSHTNFHFLLNIVLLSFGFTNFFLRIKYMIIWLFSSKSNDLPYVSFSKSKYNYTKEFRKLHCISSNSSVCLGIEDFILLYVCIWFSSVHQEAEIKRLEEEIASLQNPQKLLAEGVVSPQLEALQSENAKLKYQIEILKRVSQQLSCIYYI